MYEFDRCVAMLRGGTQVAEGTVAEYDGGLMKVHITGPFSLYPNQSVLLLVYNRVKGECTFSATVAYVGMEDALFTGLRLEREAQKRNNTRADVLLRYRITHKFEDGRTVPLEKPVDITVTNVSATGMLISSAAEFANGHIFPFVFREAGRPISLTAQVVRVEKSRRGNRYGCRFVGIPEKDSDNIFRYVLHEQIEQRRHGRLL